MVIGLIIIIIIQCTHNRTKAGQEVTLNGFLVSREPMVLCWWESETKIWFYQMS